MKRGHGDRLSGLPDAALERILSSLPSDEAVRTSALSRRWRDVYAAVPVVDLVDTKVGNMNLPDEDLKVCFDQQVTGAILCKSPGTPVRAFRLDVFSPPGALLDQWIATVVSSGAEEIDVKLRYWHYSKRRLCPFGSSKEASADFHRHDRKRFTKTQRYIFGCRTLRGLRLKNWTLDLPPSMAMSSLEKLHLARIMDPDGLLQQLLSNCPRLADLTLQECPSVGKITVSSAHLQRFAMICCHHATRIRLRSPGLQSLHYKGRLPRKSLFKVANYPGVMALAIEICEDLSTKVQTDVAPVTRLISRCTNLTYLHLSLRPSMAYNSSWFTAAVSGLPLRQLGLWGCLLNDHDLESVAALLRDVQNLEVLSLFPRGPPKKRRCSYSDGESDTESEDGIIGEGDDHNSQVPDSLLGMHIRCLDHKLRRINIEKYRGLPLEKILAKFLLSRAAALEEFSVTLADGLSRRKHAKELKSWRSNRHTRVAVYKWQQKL